MPSAEELESIALAEADDTFQSITDLDSICDTTLIAVTFVLAAIATWTAFAFDRLSSSRWLQALFVVAVILTVLVLALAVNQLVRALFPRAFTGSRVGERFPSGHLLRTETQGPSVGIARFDEVIQEDDPDLEAELEDWLDEYTADGVTDERDYRLARLFNYKIVARQKARHTARGLAWFRISLVMFLVVAIIGLVGGFGL